MNGQGTLVLGIDSSTQGTTAVVFRRDGFGAEAKVRYRDDPRLAAFGLSAGTPILPPTEEGEAHQPAALFLAALETAIPDIPPSLRTRMAAIGPSAQQHGQVWLGREAVSAIAALNVPGAGVALAAAITLAPEAEREAVFTRARPLAARAVRSFGHSLNFPARITANPRHARRLAPRHQAVSAV